MANKVYNFDTPGDYSYNSDIVTVSGGIAKLKDLTPVNETFYAGYDTDINGDRGLGVLTGIAYGGATVSGGKLDCKIYGKYVDYDAVANADSQQQGCIRFKIAPDFAGIGNKHRYFTIYKQSGDYSNFIRIMQWHNGQMKIDIYDSSGVIIINSLIGVWSPIQGQEYEFELNWDITLGETRFFIDGVQCGSTLIGTGVRDSDINLFKVGGDFLSFCSNSEFNDVQIFSTVKHTSNYTPCPCVECIYCNLKPTIEPIELFDPTHVSSWDSFLETLGAGNEGNVGYNLYKVDKTNKYYWNGGVWVTGGSVSNYNSAVVVNSNIASFDASPDKIGFISYLISDGEQKVELDENQITYTTNLLPGVNAGSDKNCKDNETIKPFSDAIISDPDGDIENVTAWYDIEGSGWTQITKTHPTLQESIREWQYTFNNIGVINCKLKIIDELAGEGEDNLNITVSKYIVTFNIKNNLGGHLPTISFKAGDGTGWQVKDSPFIHEYNYNTAGRDITIEKAGFGLQVQHIVTSDHEENFTLITLGVTTEEIYNYFIDGSREDIFKADVSGLAPVNEYDTTLSGIQSDILRNLGLSQENYNLDQMIYATYQGAKLLTGGRIRVYSDAVSVGTDSNVIATYIIAASWTDDKLQTYKVVKQ